MRPAFCIDMGSPRDSRGRNNFGWASTIDGHGSSDDIHGLIGELDRHLANGPVSLGVEAPIVIPLRDTPETLTKAREVDGNRAWNAGAGASVAVITFPILYFIMSRLTNVGRVIFFEEDAVRPGDLLIWEAFVSGEAKGKDHRDDAALALRAYLDGAREPPDQGPVLNTAAAIALRAGHKADISAPVKIVRV
jgi:hypothetical protein